MLRSGVLPVRQIRLGHKFRHVVVVGIFFIGGVHNIYRLARLAQFHGYKGRIEERIFILRFFGKLHIFFQASCQVILKIQLGGLLQAFLCVRRGGRGKKPAPVRQRGKSQ